PVRAASGPLWLCARARAGRPPGPAALPRPERDRTPARRGEQSEGSVSRPLAPSRLPVLHLAVQAGRKISGAGRAESIGSAVMSMGAEAEITAWVGGACSLAAALGVTYLALASFLVTRFRAEPPRVPARCPPASILVPLCGEDPELRDRLLALCRQAYGAALQLVCGVSDAADPAVGIVKSVAAESPGVRIDLKVDARQHGANRKISNLVNMAPLAQAQFLAIIDSDIVVGPNHLSHLASELERPGVGAVTCLYHGVGGSGLWSSLAALSINV